MTDFSVIFCLRNVFVNSISLDSLKIQDGSLGLLTGTLLFTFIIMGNIFRLISPVLFYAICPIYFVSISLIVYLLLD